jgi:hypothetical protein
MKKKYFIIALIVVMLIISGAVTVLIYQRFLTAPELTGTWSFDPEATRSFKKNASCTEDNFKEYISYTLRRSDGQIHIYDNRKIIFDKRASLPISYKYHVTERDGNLLIIHIDEYFPVKKLHFFTSNEIQNSTNLFVFIINKNQIAITDTEIINIWDVYNRVE